MSNVNAPRNFCVQCGKKITSSFQTKYCSRECWEKYKEEHSLSVSPERQATVFIKSPFSQEEPADDVRIVPKDWKPLVPKGETAGPKEGGADTHSLKPVVQQKKREKTRERSERELLLGQLKEKDKEIQHLRRKVKELSIRVQELSRQKHAEKPELIGDMVLRETGAVDPEATVDESINPIEQKTVGFWEKIRRIFRH